ncbi:MAG: transposase [Methanomassiliicoccus sp.]|nr:transposase [Methanomassiliicoccus sp.]
MFTQHQLLVLVTLRQMLAKSYRDFADWLELMTAVHRRLRIRRMPHFTTLHKFSLRLEAHTLDGLLVTLASTVADGRAEVIIDSTGFQSGSASYYYIRTMSLRNGSQGTEQRAVRHHVKATIVIDARTMMILGMLATLGPGPDAPYLRPVLEKAVEHGASIGTVIGDKGYDSESNRRYVVRELGAETHIPLRKVQRTAADHQGFYRRRQLRVFDPGLYRRRSLVETVNSMLKRTMSSATLSRCESAQYAELALRAVAHNAQRAAELLS